MRPRIPGDIDDLYDRLVANEQLKPGTKYERLAALVNHILTEKTTVHDIRLIGEVGVPHQIDVVVGDKRDRILIEAKHYDRKVGLGVLRDFSAVVEDLKPKEAFVITTVGFSAHAKKWAQSRGIRLAVLRPPRENDWKGLVRRIDSELKFSVPSTPVVQFKIHPDEGHRFENEHNPIGDRPIEDIWLTDSSGTRFPFKSVFDPLVEAESSKIAPGEAGEMEGSYDFDGEVFLLLPDEDPIRMTGFEWSQRVSVGSHRFSAGDGIGGLAAELVLRTVDGEIHRMFTNKQIAELGFDKAGQVVRLGRTVG